MNAQLAINFATTAPYARGSSTSKAAAKAVEPRMGTQKYNILQDLKQCGATGATDEQIALALDLKGDTVRPRRGALHAAYAIRKSGTRKTLSGRDADVWVAV